MYIGHPLGRADILNSAPGTERGREREGEVYPTEEASDTCRPKTNLQILVSLSIQLRVWTELLFPAAPATCGWRARSSA